MTPEEIQAHLEEMRAKQEMTAQMMHEAIWGFIDGLTQEQLSLFFAVLYDIRDAQSPRSTTSKYMGYTEGRMRSQHNISLVSWDALIQSIVNPTGS